MVVQLQSISTKSRRSFLMESLGAACAWSLCSANTDARPSELTEYEQVDACGLAELVKNGDRNPMELLDQAISLADSRSWLNAIVTPMYDEARTAIKAGLPDGPFQGVPFLLKDIGAQYAGVRYTAGSQLLADYVAAADNELVKRYKQAGLVIFGRTNSPEFALNVTTESRFLGPALNPWNKEYSTGGSSGGSAAAVAARIVPMAHASDGAGSIRIPASCCGVFGMKPSRGRMPTGPGLGEIWEGFATNHAVTRSVRDSAALLDATSNPEVGAPYGIPEPKRPFLDETRQDPRRRLKIAWTTKCSVDSDPIHDDCMIAVKDAAQLCKDLDHIVEEASPEIDYAEMEPSLFMVIEAHTAAMLDTYSAITGKALTSENVEPWTLSLAERGRKTSAVEFAANKAKINQATRKLGQFFEEYDVLLTPTLSSPPKKLGMFDTTTLSHDELLRRLLDFIPYTWIHNVAGTPAMSIPLHWNKDNLPVGVQFAAKYADESTLFGLAGQLERAKPWWDKPLPND